MAIVFPSEPGYVQQPAPEARALLLRTSDLQPDGRVTSYGGFVWPSEADPAAPRMVLPNTWDESVECGAGIHGLLWGEEDATYLNWSEDRTVWQVIAVESSELRSRGGKTRAPRAWLVYSGDRAGAAAYIAANGGAGRAIHGGTATAGHNGTATAGDRGTATAGDRGTATAGYGGTATAGDRGTATAGYAGTATAGYGGTATAGYGGTATAGEYGTATAGHNGTATAGDRGTATAGYGGTATAGYGGTLVLSWWDRTAQRNRLVVVYVGEDGIEAGVSYRLDPETHRPVRVDGAGS
jgi:hypothetical protein